MVVNKDPHFLEVEIMSKVITECASRRQKKGLLQSSQWINKIWWPIRCSPNPLYFSDFSSKGNDFIRKHRYWLCWEQTALCSSFHAIFVRRSASNVFSNLFFVEFVDFNEKYCFVYFAYNIYQPNTDLKINCMHSKMLNSALIEIVGAAKVLIVSFHH